MDALPYLCGSSSAGGVVDWMLLVLCERSRTAWRFLATPLRFCVVTAALGRPLMQPIASRASIATGASNSSSRRKSSRLLRRAGPARQRPCRVRRPWEIYFG